MIDHKYLDLIQREIDGALSPKESARLKGYLADHPQAQQLHDELVAMSKMLGEVKAVEPPSHLHNLIMNSLPRPARVKIKSRAGVRDFIASIFAFKPAYSFAAGLAVGALAFALIVYLASGGFPPSQEDVAGTIGGVQKAEKYQADQMSETDVVLSDTQINDLLQNDKVQRLIASPEFKAMMANPALASALTTGIFQANLADANLRSALASQELQAMLTNSELRAALASNELQAALSNSALTAALTSQELQAALRNTALHSALTSKELTAALANPNLSAALASSELHAALSNPKLSAALASQELQAALSSSALQAALADAELRSALTNAGFQSALTAQLTAN